MPPNLMVIGTMNTADRSILLLDAALRRSFAFKELLPEPHLLWSGFIADISLSTWLLALNRRIVEQLGRDGRNLQVGHAYLMPGGKPAATLDRIGEIVRDELWPLLREYCYETERPGRFFSKRGALGERTSFRLTRPPGFESMTDEAFVQLFAERVAERERELAEARGDAEVVGAAAVLSKRYYAKPTHRHPPARRVGMRSTPSPNYKPATSPRPRAPRRATHHCNSTSTSRLRLRRVRRGIYRLVHFPMSDEEHLVEYWLWAERAGVFSHETALFDHDLSGVLPRRTFLTVPESWRAWRLRVHAGLVLRYGQVDDTKRTWQGPVPNAQPAQAIRDVIDTHFPPEHIERALGQALYRGLVSRG